MRFCSTCGEPIKDDEKYCKNCGHKNPKKRNMIIYFILMVILFLVFEIVSSLIYSEVYAVIESSRFGMYFVVESIWAATVFIMMVLAGNKYILYRKKEPLWKSMKLAFPPMFLAIISTIYNHFNYPHIQNHINYTISMVWCKDIILFSKNYFKNKFYIEF